MQKCQCKFIQTSKLPGGRQQTTASSHANEMALFSNIFRSPRFVAVTLLTYLWLAGFIVVYTPHHVILSREGMEAVQQTAAVFPNFFCLVFS